MFKNIGGKIKGVAQFVTWLGIMASVVIFLILKNDNVLLGFVLLIVGCVGSWLSSLCLYGFGQLIENSDIIAESSKQRQLSESEDDSDTIDEYIRNDPYFRA